MSHISKIYKSKFKDALAQHGFKISGATFCRFRNDVVQAIALDAKYTTYDVGFGIIPLFWGQECVGHTNYFISKLRRGKMKRAWEFHPDSPLQHNDNEEYVLTASKDLYLEQIAESMLKNCSFLIGGK